MFLIIASKIKRPGHSFRQIRYVSQNIVNKPITVSLHATDVPDLTLVDLPGLVEVSEQHVFINHIIIHRDKVIAAEIVFFRI